MGATRAAPADPATARPPLAALMQSEAVRLFVERAQASQAAFALTPENASAVAAVCRRLDGIPLALELAAAQVKRLPVAEIAARLDHQLDLLTGPSRGALPHQQTLRAAMDWSYELLSQPEQALLRQLSVFAGGFTLEAAEAICAGKDLEAGQIVELLGRLVDKSLLVREVECEEGWYRLLETIRQYGEERLRGAGMCSSIRCRHRDWYLGLAERADAALMGADQVIWLKRLEREHDNLRAAMAWSQEQAKAERAWRVWRVLWRTWRERESLRAVLRVCATGGAVGAALRLGSAMAQFWLIRGYLSEGRERLAELAVAQGERYGYPAGAQHVASPPKAEGRQRDNGSAARRPGDARNSAPMPDPNGPGSGLSRAHRTLILVLVTSFLGMLSSPMLASLLRHASGPMMAGVVGLLLGGLVWSWLADGLLAAAFLGGLLGTYLGYFSEDCLWRSSIWDTLPHSQAGPQSIASVQLLHQQGQWLLAEIVLTLPAVLPASMLFYGRYVARAKASDGAGTLAYAQGDYAAAASLFEEGLASPPGLFGKAWNKAIGYSNVANVALCQGDYRRARALYDKSLAIWRRRPYKSSSAWHNNLGLVGPGSNLGLVIPDWGNDAARQSFLEECQARYRVSADEWWIAFSLSNLANVSLYEGNLSSARAHLVESLPIWRGLGDKRGIASALNILGAAERHEGDLAGAQAHLEESLALGRQLGDRQNIASSLNNLGKLALCQGSDRTAHALLEESLTIRRELGDRKGIAECLEGLGAAAANHRQCEWATRLFATAAALREALGTPLPPVERADYDSNIKTIRGALGEEGFAVLWAEGHAMPTEEAIQLALEGRPMTPAGAAT